MPRCEATHDKPNKMACAPSEDSDQSGHPPPSLIRVFAVHMKKAWVLSYLLSAQWRLWSVFAGRVCHFVCFVMRRLCRVRICPHEESLGPKLPIERRAKTLIRLVWCQGWPESSLGAHSTCWFCREAAQFCLKGIAYNLFSYLVAVSNVLLQLACITNQSLWKYIRYVIESNGTKSLYGINVLKWKISVTWWWRFHLYFPLRMSQACNIWKISALLWWICVVFTRKPECCRGPIEDMYGNWHMYQV